MEKNWTIKPKWSNNLNPFIKSYRQETWLKIEGIAYNKTKIVKEKNDIMVTSVKACLDVSSPKNMAKEAKN